MQYLQNFVLGRSYDDILRELIVETPWRTEKISVWGKLHTQPRLVAWYGDPDRHYTYSGISLMPLPWTQTLAQIKATVESACSESFNSVLLNYYRDERDSMGMHSDDEPELGPLPVIASLSLGETRVLTFKHKHLESVRPIKFELKSGSLLLMKGDTQNSWKHGIAKSSRPLGPRVNLTFRQVLPSKA